MKLFNKEVTQVVISKNSYESENGFIDFKDEDVEFAKNVLKFINSPDVVEDASTEEVAVKKKTKKKAE